MEDQKPDTANTEDDKLSGVERELDGTKTTKTREALKEQADKENPYPHKLRD